MPTRHGGRGAKNAITWLRRRPQCNKGRRKLAPQARYNPFPCGAGRGRLQRLGSLTDATARQSRRDGIFVARAAAWIGRDVQGNAAEIESV